MKQEFTTTREATAPSPENRLMFAVLLDAVATFQRGLRASTRAQSEQFIEVERWIRSRDFDDIFSFENICGTLEIDADCLRGLLHRVRREAWSEAARERDVRDRIATRRCWTGRRY